MSVAVRASGDASLVMRLPSAYQHERRAASARSTSSITVATAAARPASMPKKAERYM